MDNTADILAIRDLADRYSDAVNRLDIAAMAACYTQDAVLISYGTRFEGRDAIAEIFSQSLPFVFANQICSAPVITIDGDRATARWTVTEFYKRHEVDQLEVFMGTYEDEIVRTGEGWRFAQRVLNRINQARWDAKFRI